MARNVAADPAAKARALQLAAEHGAAEASRRTGIPAGTIRAWRTRSGETGPPPGADVHDWAQRKQAGALSTYEAAQEALQRVRELLRAGDERKAQAAAIALGILLDKSNILETGAAVAQEREARLAQAQAQVIAEVFRLALQAVGIPPEAVKGVMRELLEQAGRGGPLSVSPATAQEAYAAIRGHFERIIRVELEDERRALPAGDLPEPEGRAVENSVSSSDVRAAEGVEVVDAVVEEEDATPEPPGPAWDVDEVVRAVSEKINAEQDPWDALRTRTPPSSFSVDDPAASTVRYGPQRWS